MRLIRFALSLTILACAFGAYAIPAILIVRVKAKDRPLFDSGIADLVANEVQASGKMVPIVWSITDPIFRSAVDSGKIKGVTNDCGTTDQALSAASKVRADYVLLIDVRAGSGKIYGAAVLYRGGKHVWQDPDNDLSGTLAHMRQLVKKKQMTQADYDQAVIDASYRSSAIQIGDSAGLDDTLRSFARTWVEMLSNGPLLKLPKSPEAQTPEPGKGQQPVGVGPSTSAPRQPENKQWAEDVAAALKAGDGNRAVNILRDAVDAEPMDVDRRIALTDALLRVGKPELAAATARRAAELMPDKVELRLLAARAWLEAEDADEAQLDLNEVIARDANNASARILLGYVALAKGDYSTATAHLDKALATAPSGDALYFRALADAMAGNSEQAEADLKKAVAVGLSELPRDAEPRYGLVASLVDDAIASVGGDIRTLQQKAQVNRTAADVRSEWNNLSGRVAGRTRFVCALPVPAGHETSHNRRVLAYKLLTQCLIDFDSYLKSGNEDVLTDSRINLGEALKQGVSARQGFRDEQQGIKKSNGKPG